MKRATCLGYLGPLLILSGCVPAEYNEYPGLPEPPSAVQTTDALVPLRAIVQVPAREDVIRRWQLPSTSPWVPYEKLTLPSVLGEAPMPVSLPRIEDLADVQIATLAGARLAEDGLPDDTAWFVDLPGAASVAFAHGLSRASGASIAAIPTFNNWPADDELVPAEQALTAMIEMPPRLPGAEDVSARPVFLLDSWRLAYKEESIDEAVVDNRYMLTVADFPTAEVLRAHGITQVVYVVGSPDIGYEEDDLHQLFGEYEDAGIVIYLVDVNSLAGEGGAASASRVPWYVEAHTHCFIVRPRLTVMHDPRFFRRSRGGFGGAHSIWIPGGHVSFGYSSGG